MSQGHDLYLDLCAALAAGSIEPADRRVLEEHLDLRCAECLAFLRDLSGPIESLARSVPPAKPSRGLKARVMVAISQDRGPVGGPRAAPPSAAPERVLPVWAWVVIAALALAAAFGWVRASMSGKPAQSPDEPSVSPSVRRYQEFVASPGAKRLQLARTDTAHPALSKDVKVEVTYDAAKRRAAVRVTGVGAPPGHVLELWTVRAKKAHSEGLILTDGIAFVENTGDPAALEGFAVSVEPPQGAKDRETPSNVSMAAATS